MDIIDFAFIVTIAFSSVIAVTLLGGHKIALRNFLALSALIGVIILAYAQETDWVTGERALDFGMVWPASAGIAAAIVATLFVSWARQFLGTEEPVAPPPAVRTDVARPSDIDDQRFDIRA